LPPMIAKIEEANTVSEDAAQATIADAILKGIRANARFPNPNVSPTASDGWVTLAQNFYPGGLNALRYVFPEAQNFAQTERRVYLDPALLTYLSGSFIMPSAGFSSTDSDVPPDGIPDVEETALRMYIVSSSKSDLVLSCPANGATAQPAASSYNSALINDLLGWVKAYQDPTSANAGAVLVPTSIANWASVGGGNSRRGEYVHVKIVPLENLFCRVRLTDCASPSIISTISSGGGGGPPPYSGSTWYSVNDGQGTTIEVFSNPGGNITPSATWRISADSDNYNPRSTYTASTFQIFATPGVPSAANSTATFALPGFPRYQLNASGINLFTAATQNLDFYVIVGTRLRLYNGTGALLMDQNIATDCTYKYWNNTWSKSE